MVSRASKIDGRCQGHYSFHWQDILGARQGAKLLHVSKVSGPLYPKLSMCLRAPVRKLDLLQLCFFFELLFPYVSCSISLYAFLLILFSDHSNPYLFLVQDTQSKEHQEGNLFGNRKQSKIILQPKKSSKSLRLTIGSNGRPVTTLIPTMDALHLINPHHFH